MTPGIWLVIAGSMALLARAGIGWYASGMCRSKNAAGAVLRAVADVCAATLAFWGIGAAVLLREGTSPIGVEAGRLFDLAGRADAQTFIYAASILLGTAAVGGAVAERSRLRVVIGSSFVLGGLVLPLAGQWAWHGWLHRIGFQDAAGAGVIHLASACFALMAARSVGPRSGKYNRDGSANFIPGHNLPAASMGLILVWACWIPYVLGLSSIHGAAAEGRAAMNVLVCAAAAGAAALISTRYFFGKPDVSLVYSGVFAGLIASTAGIGSLPSWAGVLLGAVAGTVVPKASVALDVRFRIDDPTGGICIHGLGGILGLLAAAASPLGEKALMSRLAAQCAGIAAIAAMGVIVAVGLLWLLRAMGGLRVSEADEYDGLDLAEHDINAYPDFQQTMIKSYHLREA